MENQRKATDDAQPLPSFDGNPISAQKWLEDFETLCIEKAIPSYQRLWAAASCFTGLAREWYMQRDLAFQSWVECKEEFLVRFLRQGSVQADARVQLRRLRQDAKTSFCDHLIEVVRLCHKADPEMSEEEKVSWFLKTVRKDYRPALVVAEIRSMSSLRDKCAHIDTIEPFCYEAPAEKNPSVHKDANGNAPIPIFETKEPQTPRQFVLPADRPIGDDPPRRRRPHCSICGRYGHWPNTCYRR